MCSWDDIIDVVARKAKLVYAEGIIVIISERIFKILQERGISQASFGKMVGLSSSTISDWKTKKTNPSADKIMDICNALDITPEQLLTGKGIDDDYTRHTDMEVSFEDKEILVEYHELGEEQQKRLQAYLKTLKKLEDLENI